VARAASTTGRVFSIHLVQCAELHELGVLVQELDVDLGWVLLERAASGGPDAYRFASIGNRLKAVRSDD
jgi:hypothetical protein